MSDQPTTLFRQPAAVTPPTANAAPAKPPEKLKFEGVATMKNGSVYFGAFDEDDSGVVTVKVPTGAGDVRTVRRLDRAQIADHRAMEVPAIRKLAKIGPHVLSKADVERVAPVPPTADQSSATPADSAPATE